MYPEDRVLVAYIPNLSDFEIIRNENWYRIPQRYAPKGLHAEYFAFYFGRDFGEQKWAIHYFAEQRGNELVHRLDLFPDQSDHPRANDLYYKVSLGPLQRLQHPIVSLRWRRITFMHTIWDRFQDAIEINDLFIEGGEYVDRIFSALKENGIRAKRNYTVKESGSEYVIPLSVFCRDGRIDVTEDELPGSRQQADQLAAELIKRAQNLGGSISENDSAD